MRRSLCVLALLLPLAACGKSEPAPGGGGTTPAAPQPDPAEQQRLAEQRAQQRKQRAEELNQQRDALQAKVDELKKALETLVAAQENEKAGLPEASSLRSKLMSLIRDQREARGRLNTLESRYEKLKAVADSTANKEILGLREELKKAEERYNGAISSWRQSLEEESFGATDESPVKAQLVAMRALKRKWFETTRLARRGTANESERNIINDGIRAWVRENPVRTQVATLILGRPGGPQGKTPDTYDFTDLDFYVLLELTENDLDRQNIAVERKQLDKSRQQLQGIEQEMDGIKEKIGEKLAEGGGDLEAFQDVSEQLPSAREKLQYLDRMVGEYESVYANLDEMKERHLTARTKAETELEKAKTELAKVAAELKSLG